MLLWGLESSEPEAEVRKEGLEGEHGASPTPGAPLRHSSRADTIVLKLKLQPTIRKRSNQNMISDGILLLFEK